MRYLSRVSIWVLPALFLLLACSKEQNNNTETPGKPDPKPEETVLPSHPEETAFLKNLFEATKGTAWSQSQGWGSDKHVSEWYGVKTDADGYVVELRLENNNLSGKLPEGFDKLSRLQYLSMKNNDLADFIPSSLAKASYFRYIWGDILCGNQITKQSFLKLNVLGPEVSAKDVLTGQSITLSKKVYSEYEETYLGQWSHGKTAPDVLDFNIGSAAIRSYKSEEQEKPDHLVILISDGTEAQIKEDISYDAEDTSTTYKAISTRESKPFGGFEFYPISQYDGYGWVVVGKDGVISDTNLLVDKPEEETQMPSPASFKWGQNKNHELVAPDIKLINLSEDFKPWATINGRQLAVKYRCPSKWVYIAKGNDENDYAVINANDYAGVRGTVIYADMYNGLIPVKRLYYRVTQDAVLFRLEVQGNKADYPYWSHFDTNGENALFYSPYEETQSFIVRSNTSQISLSRNIIDNNDPQDVKRFATEFEVPSITWGGTDKGKLDYDVNLLVGATYPANRCLEYEINAEDYDDYNLRGLAKMTRVDVFPYLEYISDWETLIVEKVFVKKGKEGDILSDKLYLIQSPVAVATNSYDWEDVCPIARPDSPIPGYCPVFQEWEGVLYADQSISANVDWNWSDLLIGDDNWHFKLSDLNMNAHSDGKIITTNSYSLYAEEQDNPNEYKYDSDYGAYVCRPKKTVPYRDTRMYISVNMKDGGDPVCIPLMHVFQYAIPRFEIVSQTWDGYWRDSDNPQYNYMTREYIVMRTDDLAVGNYTKLQYHGTNSINDQENQTTTYYWKSWEDISLSYETRASIKTYSYRRGFDGYRDFRIVYPNGTCIYLFDGPKWTSTNSLPVEQNPMAWSNKRPPVSHRAKGIQYPEGKIHNAEVTPDLLRDSVSFRIAQTEPDQAWRLSY